MRLHGDFSATGGMPLHPIASYSLLKEILLSVFLMYIIIFFLIVLLFSTSHDLGDCPRSVTFFELLDGVPGLDTIVVSTNEYLIHFKLLVASESTLANFLLGRAIVL